LNARIRRCRLCETAGYIPEARPVVMDGGRLGGILLIGQAPGAVEHESGRPFGGRAGNELFRWLASVDVAEEEFRDRVYMAAVTRCFPGRALSGSGDRKPSKAEIETCRRWLEAVIETVRPSSMILVGQLAIERYLPRRRLDELIGKSFETGDGLLIPLPHPSGASRWLNDLGHRDLLKQAMLQVRRVWNEAAQHEPTK
jgi:uracil-DNA glycosylase